MQAAVKAAPNLRSVHLEGVDELTDHGIAALGSLNLRELSLVFTRAASPQILESTLLHVLCDTHCTGLEALEFSERAGPSLVLSDQGANFAQALARHGRSLRALTLSGVVGLGDIAFQILAASCPNLRELSLYKPGHQLTSAGLQEGLRQLSLEHVSLGCVADFLGAFQAIRCAGLGLRSFEMTRYFRTAADESVLSVLQHLRSGYFPRLYSAIFRGTFSSEQVSTCYEDMSRDRWETADLSWVQLDDQTFSIRWPYPASAAKSCESFVTVHLQRCFKESDFG